MDLPLPFVYAGAFIACLFALAFVLRRNNRLARAWVAIIALRSFHIRSVSTIALIAGMMALTIAAGCVIALAVWAEISGLTQSFSLARLVIFAILFMIGLFGFVIAGIAFGANFLKAKYGDKEFALGQSQRNPEKMVGPGGPSDTSMPDPETEAGEFEGDH